MPTVLLLEDDANTVDIIQAALSALDVTLHHTADGQEALDIITAQTVDLLLVDLRVPSAVKGMDVIEHVKASEQYQHIPIIILSASGGEQIMKAMKLGSDDFLEKPFSIAQLKLKVQRYLGAGQD